MYVDFYIQAFMPDSCDSPEYFEKRSVYLALQDVQITKEISDALLKHGLVAAPHNWDASPAKSPCTYSWQLLLTALH